MGTFKNLDKLLDSFTQGSIPGCACVVMQNHDIVHESYSGYEMCIRDSIYILKGGFPILLQTDVKDEVMAVSYTHLDVYKRQVILCAGGDHGDCVIHEAYQSCLDFNKLGYQSFMLLNRTNMMPYTGQECGADAARLIRMIRKDASK